LDPSFATVLRHREPKLEKQAIDFELERSEIVRQMLDVRKRLLTAQAQPHFLFNTLANAQALVEAGSPRAPKEGGCIDMHAQALQGGRCRLRVVDTGVGLRASGGGLGTGLAALQIVAQARNGRQAIELFEQHQPAICFLDVHMPDLSGVEVARHVGKRAHLVFVTAFDQYALEAFEHGVLDYLVKPVTAARLTETVERLKARLQQAQPAVHSDVLLAQLDPAHFAQVHRSVVINLRSIRRVTRGENETADIELKGRTERLPMSRSYLHLFKEM
jgi:DNA-binding LytR/AlgR family response regulator